MLLLSFLNPALSSLLAALKLKNKQIYKKKFNLFLDLEGKNIPHLLTDLYFNFTNFTCISCELNGCFDLV